MSRLRPSLIALAVAAGLLAVAAIVLFGLVRLSWFERQAEQRLSAALGWPVQLDGLAIAYYPWPRIEADGLVLPAADGDGAKPLFEADHVSVTLPWRTLAGLGGHVARLELRGPQLHLVEDDQGRGNWTGLVEKVVQLGGDGPTAFSVGELRLTDGGIDYAGAADGTWRLAGIQLTARDLRPGSPFDADLRLGGESSGHTFHLALSGRVMLDPDRDVYAADELTLDGWVGGGDLPLAGVEWDGTIEALHADLGAGRTTLRGLQARSLGVELAGELERVVQGAASTLSFAVQTRPFSPRAVGVGLDRPLPETNDPAALTRAVLDVTGDWTAEGLTLSRLQGELDDSTFSGDAVLPTGDAPPRLRMTVDRLDLDRYLPPADPEGGQEDTLPAAVEGLRESLEALDLEAEVTIGEARAANVIARELTIRLEPLSPATAGDGG